MMQYTRKDWDRMVEEVREYVEAGLDTDEAFDLVAMHESLGEDACWKLNEEYYTAYYD